MEGGGKAVYASDGDFQDEAGSWPSFHADQHGQLSVDVQKSRPVGGGGKAACVSDGDEQDEAGS